MSSQSMSRRAVSRFVKIPLSKRERKQSFISRFSACTDDHIGRNYGRDHHHRERAQRRCIDDQIPLYPRLRWWSWQCEACGITSLYTSQSYAHKCQSLCTSFIRRISRSSTTFFKQELLTETLGHCRYLQHSRPQDSCGRKVQGGHVWKVCHSWIYRKHGVSVCQHTRDWPLDARRDVCRGCHKLWCLAWKSRVCPSLQIQWRFGIRCLQGF